MAIFDTEPITLETPEEVQPTQENSEVNGEVQTEENQEENNREQSEENETTAQSERLFANKYKTEGGLFKGVINIAQKIGDKIDVDKMTISEAESYYQKAQERLFKGDYEEQPKKAKISPEVQAILEKLDKLSVFQQPPVQKAEEPIAEPEPEIDESIVEKLVDNPKDFIKMLTNLIESNIDRKLKPAEEKILKAIQPVTESAQAIQKQQEKMNLINTAKEKIRQDILEHGDGDFDNPEIQKEMMTLLRDNPDDYPDDNPERSFRRLYRDVKREHEFSNLKKLVEGKAAETKQQTTAVKKSTSMTSSGTGAPKEQAPENEVDDVLERIMKSETKGKGIFG